MIIEYDGTLEIDYNRGVIYFHSAETGHSMLRICQLKLPTDTEVAFVDITAPEHMSVIEREKRYVI